MDPRLETLLSHIHAATTFDFAPRDETRLTIISMGITTYHVEEYISQLTYREFHKGPMNDQNGSTDGDIWVFKTILHGRVVYIKLKWYEPSGQPRKIKVLSFHEDE